MEKRSNRLKQETSPYLLQHAHNPVDWYPWGEEALLRAKSENKPILVSIGYAACHWCHVMERESFEDEQTAHFMNSHFINIKIDREERPDLDHIYMDAVQAMSGSGGWPLNVFLTPDKKPFFGGTYFPPVRAFNRSSWMEVLQGVSQAFTERREEIESQAENLTTHLLQSNAFGLQSQAKTSSLFTSEKVGLSLQNIIKTADMEWGGFGNAPKFPQTFTIQFLLRYYHVSQRSGDHARADVYLKQALLSLDKMIDGGIYDQLGGGFARYSTDRKWLAPHFEKMLYDNALLVAVLSEAFQLTQKPRYREVMAETIGFAERELLDGNGGFYSALDADSEGEEGKYYTWSKEEIDRLLGSDAPAFCNYYNVIPQGNWPEGGEKRNILWVTQSAAGVAKQQGLEPGALQELLARCKRKLLAERSGRVRPQLDDKVILGWNALMNTACSKAFAATGEEAWRRLALRNMDFLLKHFRGEDGVYHHTWKNGQAKYPAFLDDYAFLVQALLHLQEITGDTAWLSAAGGFTEQVIKTFSEKETGFFFYTPEGQSDVIVRKKEVYDGAVPSGNAIMADNLHRLGILLDRPEWRERSDGMMAALGEAIVRYPTSFGCWNNLLLERTAGTAEIVVAGAHTESLHGELLRQYLPHRVVMVGGKDAGTYPLVEGKPAQGKTLIYLCKDFACLQPVDTVEGVMSLINNAPWNN